MEQYFFGLDITKYAKDLTGVGGESGMSICTRKGNVDFILLS